MNTREQLDYDLDKLAGMLPIWLEMLRDPAGFWSQFDALSQKIIDNSSDRNRDYVRRRLKLMLQKNHLQRPHTPGF